MIEIIIFIISGILIGVVAGLYGLGGGLLIVPVVSYSLVFFSKIPISEAILIGITTSLASMVLTGAMAVYAHKKNNNIDYIIIKKFILGLIIGSILIGFTIKYIPGNFLKNFFILYTFFIAYKLIKRSPSLKNPTLPSSKKANFISFSFAMISGLLGIGGATLFVPYLISNNISSKIAIGTSSAFGFLIGLFATISIFLSSSFLDANHLSIIGYIYLPAILFLTLPSLIFVKLSANWLLKISDVIINRSFGILLIMIGTLMLFNQ